MGRDKIPYGKKKKSIRIWVETQAIDDLGVFKTAELAYERYKEVRAKIEFSNLHK